MTDPGRRTTGARPELADLCSEDPLDLERDPRLRATPPPAAEPCGPLCTPWCLASHA